MMNTQELVGTLMQGVLANSSQGRIEHALGSRGLSRPGGYLSRSSVVRQVALAPVVLSGLAEMAKSMFGSAGQGVGVVIRSPLVDWAHLLARC